MKITKIVLLVLLGIFLFCFNVNATDYKYGVGVEALGFQTGQAYYGAGTGASVNSFSGNLVLTSTDASILGANGLGASFTRVYNSNVYATKSSSYNDPQEYNMLKPSWLGHGWNAHFGKIIVPFWGGGQCPSLVYGEYNFTKESKFYLESGDGSRQLMASSNPYSSLSNYLENWQSTMYASETLYSYEPTNFNGKKFVFILPDFSRVIWYHAINRKCECVNTYAGDSFVRITTDGTKYYYTHWVEKDGPYSDIDLPEYNSALGYTGNYRQLNYLGVYLTKVVDSYGNEININYYNQSSCLYAYYCGIDSAPNKAKARTCGSPFIQSVITKNKYNTITGRIDFYVTNSNNINGRLDYLTYKNSNGKTIKVDYVYSGDPESEDHYTNCGTGATCCSDAEGEVCYSGALLTKVKIIDQSTNQELFKPIKYEYSKWKQDPYSFFALNKIISPLGAETEYEYKNILNTPCPGENYGVKRKQVGAYTLKGDSNDIGLRTDYDYSFSTGTPGVCNSQAEGKFARKITITNGPVNNEEEYTKTTTEYFYLNPFGDINLGYNDYVSGKPIITKIYGCDTPDCGEDKVVKEERTTYTEPMVYGIIDDIECDPYYSSNHCYLPGYDPYSNDCIDTTCSWAYYSLPSGTLTKITENSQIKLYAGANYYNIYKYGDIKSNVNFGEIYNFFYNESRFTSFKVDDSNNPDDAILNQYSYYYESHPEFEGSQDAFKNFIRLPENVSVKSCKVNSNTHFCLDDLQELTKSKFGNYNDKGDLLSSSVYDDVKSEWLTTTFDYDSYGNVERVINPDGKEYFMSYLNGVVLKSEWVNVDGNALMKKYAYSNTQSPGTYTLIRQDDENGQIYRYKYDDLGRLTKVYLPGDGDNRPSSEIEYCDPGINRCAEGEISATVRTKKDGNEYLNPITTYYDSLGRHKRTEQLDVNGRNIVVDTLYNEESLVDAVSKPYYEPNKGFLNKVRKGFEDIGLVGKTPKTVYRESEVKYIEYLDYDALNRLKEVKAAGADLSVKTDFGPNWNKVIDENGKNVKTFTDAYGRTITVVDSANEVTRFEYNKLGNLVKTTDAKGQVSTSDYNSLGQALESHHPDAGNVVNTYDKSGNLLTSNDGVNSFNYDYDEINRLVKIEVGDDVVKELRYDYCQNGKGKLCSVISRNVDGTGYTTLAYEYNEKRDVVKLIETINNKFYEVDYEYYDSGSLKNIIYPDGKIVNYEYDDLGRLLSVKVNGELIENIEGYNVEGTISSLRYGNEIITEYNYNDRDWLKSINVFGDAEVFTRSYNYDNVGNIVEEFSDANNINQIAEYSYDNAYRLTYVNDLGIYNGETDLGYSYDAVGNRLYKTIGCPEGEISCIGGKTTSYGYNYNKLTLLKEKGTGHAYFDLFGYDYSVTGNTEGKTGKDINIKFDSTGVFDVDTDYAIWNLDLSLGDPVKVMYDDTTQNGEECEGAVWEAIIQEYPEPNIYNRKNVVLINGENLIQGSGSNCPYSWYSRNQWDTYFTVKPSNVDYVYDYANRLNKVVYNDGTCEGYVYNPNGLRVEKVSTKDKLKTYYIYDASGNVIMEKTEEFNEEDCVDSTQVNNVCGNRIIESGEACDVYVNNGNIFTSKCSDFLMDGICAGLHYLSGSVSCTSDCSSRDMSDCSNPNNNILDEGEVCDFGNSGLSTLTCNEYGCAGTGVYSYCACPGSDWDYNIQNPNNECDCSITSHCVDQGGICISAKNNNHFSNVDMPDTWLGCECINNCPGLLQGCAEEAIYSCDDGNWGINNMHFNEGTYITIEECGATSCCLKWYFGGGNHLTEIPAV